MPDPYIVQLVYLALMKLSALLLLLLFCFTASAQNFRFAFISDTHIGSPNGGAEEDLRRTVADINSQKDIAFVVITGDITELGTDKEIALAKRILDSLTIPYYIIPGNHDTGWSESGGLSFSKIFGSETFHFVHQGIHFIGCASGPYVRMSDGHIPRHNMNWITKELGRIKQGEPIVFLNHYPLDNGLDNWYEVIDLLKAKNTVLALCGHGHNNRPVKAEDIPAVMGRSNLRAKEAEGGYNLVDVSKDSFLFTERRPLSKTEKKWTGLAFSKQDYTAGKKYMRPDFSVNEKYKAVKEKWSYRSNANIISTPVVTQGLVIVGNQNGLVEALDSVTGRRKWKFATKGPIFSSPAASGNKVVLGSADGNVYCLTIKGNLQWKVAANAAVLASPLINDGIVYIGSSDHIFRAIDLQSGRLLWSIEGVKGAVTSRPVLHNNLLIFGAWDGHLYALDIIKKDWHWKWNSGNTLINFSPAACIPVVKDEVVYIAAPDRFLSAININTGQTLWRTKEAAVRESIGIAENGQVVYGKTMQDTIVAFYTAKEAPKAAWKMHAGFGYEHVPSMLIEKEGTLFFGTKNGVVYAIDPLKQSITWAHKIDNSMVNTVQVLNGKTLIASTMDGKVCLLQASFTYTPDQP
jgi:outer membrane protein assembly factor BamB/Icc-related predicted phosphoesterase